MKRQRLQCKEVWIDPDSGNKQPALNTCDLFQLFDYSVDQQTHLPYTCPFLKWDFILKKSTWLIEKLYFCITILQRAASVVLLRGQKAASCCISPSLLPPQAPKKQLTGPERCCLNLWRECSRRKTGKRWGRGKRKNDTTESPRTHPDNRSRLRVSRRVPLRQRSVCNSLRLGHRLRTVDAQDKINPKKCQLSSWNCKKDPNGLYGTTASLIPAPSQDWISRGNHTA